VKNVFLHSALLEEVYMEIPPGFGNEQTLGKVCKLKKSLYGPKQSPQARFDWFRQAVCDMGYSNPMEITHSSTDIKALISLSWMFMLMIK